MRSASGWYASQANGQSAGSLTVLRRISNSTPKTRRDGRLSSPAQERTELKLGEGVNRNRAGRLSRHRRDGESRRLPDDRMLWKGNALKLFATFPTMNSVHSKAAEPRLHSCHVFMVPIGNRSAMTTRDGASELPHSNEVCDPTQGGTLRTPPARGPAVSKFKTDLHLNFNVAPFGASELNRKGTN
jgi:hypothetical protein